MPINKQRMARKLTVIDRRGIMKSLSNLERIRKGIVDEAEGVGVFVDEAVGGVVYNNQR